MLRILLLLLFSTNLFAAEWYIRAGATGTGVDWANALPALPTTLNRGDTYYIAGGSYPSYTFDDPVSGSLLITIKKATEVSHGTNTGWDTSYGTTQANFTAPLTFSTAYWLFDGQTRNESDWFAGAAYGFKVTNNAGDYGPTVYMYGSNVTVAYAWMVGETVNSGTTTRGYVMDYESPTTTTGTVVTHSFAQKSSNHFFLRNVNGAIVEYSASSDADSNPFNHGESVNLYGYFGKSDNVIVRYNIFKDNFLGDVGTAVIAIVGATGNEIYGNVFYNNNTTDGAIGWNGTGPSGYAVSNTKIYNNTFGGGGGYNQGINFESTSNAATNIVQNNIFCGSGTYSFTQVTASFNAFCGSSAQGTTDAQINMPTSVFVNFASKDFRLNAATTAGNALASPYNLDMLNTTRGVDASWDRGAFEYVTPLPPFVPPSTPSAWYKFTTNLNDEYGNHGIATLAKSPTFASNLMYCDGNDEVTVPYLPFYDFNDGTKSQVTISVWVKPTTDLLLTPAAESIVVGRYTDAPGTNSIWQLNAFGGNANNQGAYARQQNVSGAFAVAANVTPPKDQWTHLVYTYDSINGQQRLYVNGITGMLPYSSVNRTPLNTLIKPAKGTFSVCGVPTYGVSNAHFTGYVKDLILYNRALTQAEISTIYTTSAP